MLIQQKKENRFWVITTMLVLGLVTGCSKDKPVNDSADSSAAMSAAKDQVRDVKEQDLNKTEGDAASGAKESSTGAMDDAVGIANLPPVYFDFDDANVRKSEIAKIRRVGELMQKYPVLEIRFEGHADDRGSADYNFVLGKRRADSVKELVLGYGLSKKRVSTQSFGEEFPVVRGEDAQSYAKNRRVEFVITKK